MLITNSFFFKHSFNVVTASYFPASSPPIWAAAFSLIFSSLFSLLDYKYMHISNIIWNWKHIFKASTFSKHSSIVITSFWFFAKKDRSVGSSHLRNEINKCAGKEIYQTWFLSKFNHSLTHIIKENNTKSYTPSYFWSFYYYSDVAHLDLSALQKTPS